MYENASLRFPLKFILLDCEKNPNIVTPFVVVLFESIIIGCIEDFHSFEESPTTPN